MPFNRLNHSILGEIRPRFALKIGCTPEIAIQAIDTSLQNDKTVVGDRSGNLIFLRIPILDRHYWSPEMTVRIEIDEYTNDTNVACLIGPMQSVWALWAFIYSSIALVTIFSGIFGFVQYHQQSESLWLWIFPIGILAILSAFMAAKIGQRKGRDQMLHLVSFLYHSLNHCTTVERQ